MSLKYAPSYCHPLIFKRGGLNLHNSSINQNLIFKSQFIELFGDYVNSDLQWENTTLQELINRNWITYHLDGNHGGEYPRSEEFVKAGIPYVSANCIADGTIDFSNAKYVTSERAKRFRKGIAQDQDVLFAHNATVGPVAILETTEPVVILGTSLTSYRCNTEYMLPKYLKAYLECEYFVRQYEAEMQQSTRKQVPITTQRKYSFVVPPIALQIKFATFSQQVDKSKYVDYPLTFLTNLVKTNYNLYSRRNVYVH